MDASRGWAQTLANVNLALNNNLEMIPVINKIDLPAADPERVKHEIEEALVLDASSAVLASAKEGIGTEEILEAVVQRIPPPSGDPDAPLRALIFDSHFDAYLGVVAYVRVVDGCIRPGQPIRMMSNGKPFEVSTVGIFRPRMERVSELRAGEVGFLTAGIKSVSDCQVGDTITDAKRPAATPLPGYKRAKPMVFCGLYPVDSRDYPELKDALAKLQLNDAALTFEPESSAALGFGYRCGFLGLLHMEIIQERLEREFELDLVATAPSVVYRVTTTDGAEVNVDNRRRFLRPPRSRDRGSPTSRRRSSRPRISSGPAWSFARAPRRLRALEYRPQPGVDRYDLPLSRILMDNDQLRAGRRTPPSITTSRATSRAW